MKTIFRLLVATSAVLGSAAIAATPFTFPRSTPEEEGVSSVAIRQFIDAADAKVDTIHSFMLVRHGHVAAEGWWNPYGAAEPHTLFSLSKSFTSTAVGLAVAEGRLSIDDAVLKFFPESAPKDPSKNLQALRVRDLLTMTTGQHLEDIDSFPFDAKDGLVRKFLAMPVVHKPGTFFAYNTPATYVQSALVQRVTGQTVLEYLRPRLFEPLGIENPTWQASAEGVSFGGFGLSLRTEDIARFGLLYLHHGRWEGKQLIPEAWVEQATAKQVSNGSDPTSDWDQGYGFQFWRCRHGFYRGDGAFGQLCIVMPEYDAVIAITSGTRDMGALMSLVWEHVLPGLKPNALPANAAAANQLRARLAQLEIPTVNGNASAPTNLGGKRFVFPANPMIASIAFGAISQEGTTIVFGTEHGEQTVTIPSNRWQRVPAGALSAPDDPVALSGAWTAKDTYTLKLCRYRSPLILKAELRIEADLLTCDTEMNVGFGKSSKTQLVAHAETR